MHGTEDDLKSDDPVVPDDASSLTATDEPAAALPTTRPSTSARRTRTARPTAEPDAEPKKTDGESDAK